MYCIEIVCTGAPVVCTIHNSLSLLPRARGKIHRSADPLFTKYSRTNKLRERSKTTPEYNTKKRIEHGEATGKDCQQDQKERSICKGRSLHFHAGISWWIESPFTTNLLYVNYLFLYHITNFLLLLLLLLFLLSQFKAQKKVAKKKAKSDKIKEIEELGEAAPPKQIPRTIENTRVADETSVLPNDIEILGDEADDEFADYYKNIKKPKIMLTTRPKCSKKLYDFIGIWSHLTSFHVIYFLLLSSDVEVFDFLHLSFFTFLSFFFSFLTLHNRWLNANDTKYLLLP